MMETRYELKIYNGRLSVLPNVKILSLFFKILACDSGKPYNILKVFDYSTGKLLKEYHHAGSFVSTLESRFET